MKYPGSKYDSLDELLPHLPHRGSFIDVFGGSGTVLFNRPASKLDVYNDRYGGICAFYRALRDHPRKLCQRLEVIVHSREEWEWCLRTWEHEPISISEEALCLYDGKISQEDMELVERAARWYYMVQNSFVGLGRSFARVTKPTTGVAGVIANKLDSFWPIHQRLKRVQIENLDWRDCLNDFDNEQAVFYLDPPYFNADMSGYTHKMPMEDHIELCTRIMSLKGFVALSGYPNEIYDQFTWDKKVSWGRRDRANGMATSEYNNRSEVGQRGILTEMLWIKEARP